MNTREALKVILLEYLSDPEFERELYKRKLLRSNNPLTPTGQLVAAEEKRMQDLKLEAALDHLFGLAGY